MAAYVFPLKYTFRTDVKKTSEFINKTVVFESQKKQKQRKAISKLCTWEITCEGDVDDLHTLESFHEAVGGDAGTFSFYNEMGGKVTVRFMDGKLPVTLKREFSTNNMGGTVVGFTCTLTLEKVI